jgi:hypothetical protein
MPRAARASALSANEKTPPELLGGNPDASTRANCPL